MNIVKFQDKIVKLAWSQLKKKSTREITTQPAKFSENLLIKEKRLVFQIIFLFMLSTMLIN